MKPSTFSFASLNLSGIETERPSGNKVEIGPQTLTITEAKVRPTNSGNGFQLEVKLEDSKNAYIRDFITIQHSSADAQKFGRQRLKALLTYAGHPSPDEPGDVSSIVGRQVGVHVVEEEREITDDRTGQPKKIKVAAAKKFGAYFSHDGSATPPRTSSSGTPDKSLDDEIPF